MTPPGPAAQSRVLAARAVAQVLGGRSLDDVLPPQADGFARALCFGVLRHYARLDALLSPLTARPLKSGSELHALVLCGIYQLLEMDVAEHAALNETVNACEALGQGGARGLVNALLRRVQRERDPLIARLPADPRVQFSYPDWLVNAIARDWGAVTERLLAAGNEQGPMTLRVNRRRSSREAYLERLHQAGLLGHALDGVADAIRLETPVAVEKLPGFASGEVSVQDAAAQLAADLLDLHDGQRVLDACSAPGGKAAHILERAQVQLTAVDNSPARLGRVRQTLDRLGLDARLALSDAAHVKRWWDGQAFDRILIDAPCSGTGVIRRHPDIKWLRRANDLPPLALTQRRLLDRLWPLLAPGGVLVYATCSILNAEGDDILRGFLQRTPDARLSAMQLPVGLASRCGIRIAPGGDFDGFYYARLTRRGSPAPGGVG
ncbi:MAG: 16S rRNA (cytosine(967)-C(5))-methyltransferase RsmB [Gammaproteobacteria bacterium]